MNILVCDDDREIAKAVGIYLEKEGYNVIMAYDGQEALKACRKNDIHLILMDIMMPKLDGIKATMKIREEKNIPIIMLSAKSARLPIEQVYDYRRPQTTPPARSSTGLGHRR